MTERCAFRVLALSLGLCFAAAAWAGKAKPAAQPAPAPKPAVVTSYQIRTDRSGNKPNWFTGQLEAVGVAYAAEGGEIARYQSLATAQTIMQHEAAKGLAALTFDGQTKVGSLTDEKSQALIKKLLAGTTIIEERWDAKARSYTVVGVIPLYGANGVAMLGMDLPCVTDPMEVKTEEMALITAIPKGHTPQPYEAPYTGVIINCESVALTPCLFPSLLRSDGKTFWGPAALIKPEEIAKGIIHYVPNLDTALQQQLAGKHPLILTAIGTGRGCHPVTNIDDVFLALSQQKSAQLLQTNVVITLGR